ncbi:MAG: hypothetical protein HKN47_17470 [Pirellulaceae bacterium]|nr:hypothetical protein [Pirellulaceae bacterium]
MRHFLVLALLCGFIVSSTLTINAQTDATAQSDVNAQAEPSSQAETRPPLSLQQVEENLEGEFRAEDIAAANTWIQTLNLADWLGPLAPLALSPFFGMACLSGLALYGPDWITDNALLGASGPLQNQWLFFVFVGLTVLTSVPRLSKVSKPFAQAVDQIETYSVIIILLAIKLLAGIDDEPAQVAVVQLGVLSFTANTLLMIAMVLNIVVVNSVKFFFEFLVWLTPIPTLDAMFELCNKAICAALVAVYAFSPTLATLLNLVILVASLLVFRWISRRIRFYRTMVMDPVLSRLWPSYGQLKENSLIVFPKAAIGPFSPKSRLRLTKTDHGWTLTEANWWLPTTASHDVAAVDAPAVQCGWVMHCVTITEGEYQHTLSFSRRHDHCLDDLAERLGLTLPSESDNAPSKDQIAVEFS